MDTKGQSKGDEGSRRSHSLFNGIINLSPHGIKAISQGLSSSDFSSHTGVIQNVPINLSNTKAEKRCSKPLRGPAPKTLSILTALNELSISDQVDDVSCGGIKGDSLRKDECHKSYIKLQSQQSFDQMLKGKVGQAERFSQDEAKTPDWARKIFQLAKHGRLNELKGALDGMDLMMIRHLVDSKGRTLFHHAAGGGQLSCLQWLMTVLGSSISEAGLKDQDEWGQTPILTALHKRKAECFECVKWLVLISAKKPAIQDGERGLLHFAANYGNVVAVRWLSQYLRDLELSVDVKDLSSGMTPLCEAAAVGNLMACHELIIAGANPLYQTELGWRPVDFAISQNQLECVSYLTMAETGFRLGNELEMRGTKFQKMEQQHDSLCKHLCDLLRVGKWLVKERTKLIKHFAVIGGSEESGSFLLGETSNGTRFSDLEHKLVQAEQELKHLLTNKGSNINMATSSHPPQNNTYNFQHLLAAAQCQNEKMLMRFHSSASFDNDTNYSSEEEIDNVSLVIGTNKVNKQENSEKENNGEKFDKFPIAPWLLPPDESTHVGGELNLLHSSSRMKKKKRDIVELQGKDGCVSGKTLLTKDQRSSARSHMLSSPETLSGSQVSEKTTVLEVIQAQISNKSAPDLIRELSHFDFSERVNEEWVEGQGERAVDKNIYSRIKGLSPNRLPLRCGSSPQEFVPNGFSQQTSGIDASSSFSTTCQKQSSSSDAILTKTITSHLSSPTTLTNGQDSCNQSHQQICDFPAEELSKPQETELLQKPSSTFLKGYLTETLFPAQVVSQPIEGSIDFVGNSGQVVPESFSTSNTPGFSSSSPLFHSSTTILFPCTREWSSPELAPLMNSESGRISPSPSETSKAEAFASPPSHHSNISEASQTESAIIEMSHCDSESNDKVTTESIDLCRVLDRSKTREFVDGESSLRSTNVGAIQRSSSTEQLPLIVSAPSHKAAGHHATKWSGRRHKKKAWYEIEGSDDEEKEYL